MKTKGVYNYYVHMVHFISEAEQEKKIKDSPISGTIELIIVLVHYVKKDQPLYLEQPEIRNKNE